MTSLLSKIKQKLQRTIWPLGVVAKIYKGHLKGYRFIVSENSGWSPILGRWEPASHEIFAKMIKPGNTVFDLGANNGIHSMLFSKLAGDKGKVFAFEPLPDNITEIEKNIALNNITNIVIVPAAVSNTDGETTFLLGHSNKQGSIVGIGNETGKKVNVKLVTLKTFIEKENIQPDFIKIDIEGAESDALEGLGALFSTMKPLLFIELHTPEQDRKVSEILQRFKCKVYKETAESVQNDLDVPYLKRIDNLNLFHPNPNGVWGTILAVPL